MRILRRYVTDTNSDAKVMAIFCRNLKKVFGTLNSFKWHSNNMDDTLFHSLFTLCTHAHTYTYTCRYRRVAFLILLSALWFKSFDKLTDEILIIICKGTEEDAFTKLTCKEIVIIFYQNETWHFFTNCFYCAIIAEIMN